MKNKCEELDFISLMKDVVNEDAAVLQKIELPNDNKKLNIYLKREDLLHKYISGNKWHKLKHNLIEAKKQNKNTILTFGGAYSNHIHATASSGKIFGFKTIGIIRGEEHLPLNPTLEFAKQCGMEIHYVDRSTYRRKREEEYIRSLYKKYGDFYLIPEGGTNSLAVKGCSEIIENIQIDFDYLLTACGTGGTISGLISGLDGKNKLIGVPVLKGAEFLITEISDYVYEYSKKEYSNWELKLDYHFGGYAKITRELIQFIKSFKDLNNIQLDPIYTGKLMFAINDMVENYEFEDGSTIIGIHTGGLQGIAGMKNKVDKLLS